MAKDSEYFRNSKPTLGFTEFDILEKYRKSFNERAWQASFGLSV